MLRKTANLTNHKLLVKSYNVGKRKLAGKFTENVFAVSKNTKNNLKGKMYTPDTSHTVDVLLFT